MSSYANTLVLSVGLTSFIMFPFVFDLLGFFWILERKDITVLNTKQRRIDALMSRAIQYIWLGAVARILGLTNNALFLGLIRIIIFVNVFVELAKFLSVDAIDFWNEFSIDEPINMVDFSYRMDLVTHVMYSLEIIIVVLVLFLDDKFPRVLSMLIS